MSKGGGSGSSNTVTQTEEIPAYEQASSQYDQQLAQSLASQPYPQYQGALIQGFSPLQEQSFTDAQNAANAYIPYQQTAGSILGEINQNAAQPFINEANTEAGAANQIIGSGQQYAQAGANVLPQAQNAFAQAQALTNPNAIAGYMSPYIQASLAPQLQDLDIQNAQQQNTIDAAAAQGGAYGDARQGTAQGLQNLVTDQAVNQVTGQAYQTAFNAANQALGQAQTTNVNAGQGYNQTAGAYGNLAGQAGNLANTYNNTGTLLNNLGGTALNQQTGLMNQANAYANLGGLAQQLGLTGASAEFTAGQQQQNQGQTELNTAYQQYLNQVNWPYQQLNTMEGAISNSPYNIQTATTLPTANTTAQGFGAVAAASGLLNNALKSG